MNNIFTLVLLIIIATITAGCASISKDQLLGHNMMQSAGLNIEPGAVVLINKQNPFNGSVICSSKNAFGSTIKFHTHKIDNHTVTASSLLVALQDRVTGVRSDSSNNVYTNIQVQTISDTEIIEHAQHRNFSPACVSAIERNLKAGKPLAMITSVMIGNAEIETSRQSTSASDGRNVELGGQRNSGATTNTTNHKIGVKFSQMQLSILTETMGISENPKDNPPPVEIPNIF